jgi:hypothetical protein
MARHVPAHQHAFMSLLVPIVLVLFIGGLVLQRARRERAADDAADRIDVPAADAAPSDADAARARDAGASSENAASAPIR